MGGRRLRLAVLLVLLMTPATSELSRVLPPSASVHLVGGPAALSEDVAEHVAALDFRVV